MQEIKCPNCGTVFQVEESDYAEIVKQVRDKEFNKELKERETQFASDKENALKLQKIQTDANYNKLLLEKDNELTKVSGKAKADLDAANAKAKADLDAANAKAKADFDAAAATAQSEYATLKAQKDAEIAELRAKIATAETEKQLAVSEAVAEKEKALSEKDNAILGLNAKLENAELLKQSEKTSLKESYELLMKEKDDEIARYKEFKLKLSTKGLGESLEQFCSDEFNKYRATGFRNAYFMKDNDARNGSKGDFIFREKTPEDDLEFISIMFEMKNEADETATKHKNVDFLKELDKDRKEKNCEYAVLVSMLEPESDLYNNGIVDVSYMYDKMYVIRPQFFIPMITLLRNASLNSVSLKRDLILAQSQSIDVTNFEEKLNIFKDKFSNDCRLASDKFNGAIDEIDKSIAHLQKIKDFLTGANNHLRLANNKADDLTIKKLTWQNPTMKAKFEAARKASSNNPGEITEVAGAYTEVSTEDGFDTSESNQADNSTNP